MPSPSAQLLTLRPDLADSFEQYDLASSWLGFVGTKILTVVETMEQAGNFGIIPIEQLLSQSATHRAPGSKYSRDSWEFKPGTFNCKEHGKEEVVDDREAKMYANYFSAEQKAAIRARDKVLRNLETRIINLFQPASSTYGGFSTQAVTATWKNINTSDPATDVTAAIEAVYAASGLYPNCVVMGFNAWRNFKRSAAVIQQIKYSGKDDPKTKAINTAVAAELFDVENVWVAGAQYNAAGPNLAASLTQLWNSDNIFVGRVCMGDDFAEPGVGRTFHWGGDGSDIGAVIESYRDESVRGNVVRVRMDTDEQIIFPAAGFILTGANS